MRTKYGVDHPNQVPEFKEKMLISLGSAFMERYGVENVMQNSDIAAK